MVEDVEWEQKVTTYDVPQGLKVHRWLPGERTHPNPSDIPPCGECLVEQLRAGTISWMTLLSKYAPLLLR